MAIRCAPEVLEQGLRDLSGGSLNPPFPELLEVS